MQTVTIFDAKTHLSKLIKNVVENEEEIIITKHNIPAAIIMPISKLKKTKYTFEDICKLKSYYKPNLTNSEIQELIALNKK